MNIQIRKGSLEDTEQLIRFLQEVHENMENKDWLYLDPAEDVWAMMRSGMMELWVAMDGNRLAAAFTILHPGLDYLNYGYDLDLSEEDLLRVINMDTIAVHPNYRGMGLQRKLVGTAEGEMAERGKKILLCTVHPYNEFSLNNFLRQGYVLERILQKYGSVRCVLRKDLL